MTHIISGLNINFKISIYYTLNNVLGQTFTIFININEIIISVLNKNINFVLVTFYNDIRYINNNNNNNNTL